MNIFTQQTLPTRGHPLATMSILGALALAGCAAHPRTFRAPDSSAVEAAGRRLRGEIATARDSAKAVSAHVARVALSADREGFLIASQEAKLASLFRAAPPSLRPAVESLEADNARLAREHAYLVDATRETQRLQAAHEVRLGTAIPEAEAALARADADYGTHVEALAKQATSLSSEVASQSRTISWYRWHWWGSWVAFSLGAAACGFLAVCKFTGRAAFTAGAIAARV